jgi:hypothetical protein
MAQMALASVSPHYVTKVIKKSRAKKKLHAEMQDAFTRELTFEVFFDLANLNPKADQTS